MVRRVVGMSLMFGIGFFAVAVTAADPVKEKPVDWSKWTTFAVWTGEVGSTTAKGGQGFSLKTTTTTQSAGGRNRRPTTKTQSNSTDVVFAEGALVRWAKLPPKLDEKGKKVVRKPEELAELKQPAGVKGYAADSSDLKPGHYVEVTMVRPKGVLLKDLQLSDLRVKQVMIVGENPNPQPNQPGPKGKGKAKN